MASDSSNRFLIFVVLVLTVVATSAMTATFMKSGASDGALGDKVAQFIIENPEVVANALRQAQKIEQERLQREAEKAITGKREELEADEGTPVVGNPNGDVTVVEFFDYNCGYCKKIADDLAKLIEADKNVKIVLKEFPILGPSSETAARAGMAAYRLDKEKYFAFHVEMLKGSARDEAAMLKLAEKVGYKADKMKKEMASEEITKQLAKHRELAAAVGIRGTPSFIINGQLQRGAMDFAALKGLVENARAAKK